MAATTPGHRGTQMTVAAQAWQPIEGTGSAHAVREATTTATSINVPSTAVGMIITANVNCTLGLHSTHVPTVSQGFFLASMTPSPALLLPRHGAFGAGVSKVLYRASTGVGTINFLFITGRGS